MIFMDRDCLGRVWGGALCFIADKNKDLTGFFTFLCLGAPLFFTHRADVDELEIHLVVLDIHDIARLGTCVALTSVIGTFDACHVGKGRIKLGKGVQKDFIPLGCLLLEINLQNESSFRILFLIPTVLTDAHQLILLLVQIQEEPACGTEISRLHRSTIYRMDSRFNFMVGRNSPADIESDTRERLRAPVKIDRLKKGCRVV